MKQQHGSFIITADSLPKTPFLMVAVWVCVLSYFQVQVLSGVQNIEEMDYM